MFSTRTLRAVTVTPLGERAWVARCERCAHAPLTAALHVLGTAEIFAGGTLRVTEDASGESRTAPGLWHLRASNGTVDVVLTLPSERYVAAGVECGWRLRVSRGSRCVRSRLWHGRTH